ncbi:hypothetical protein SPRG_06581 [Saprolegnia parasitica CBS 223.65]|uniref:Uncharacterized protein n=1 Tax=Saprolegnia parasitica (strain CBS 223.65) TaxID=695850 RepID=A0A067CNE8_SAPPC|nr:hypothetical protein SPRG_06581 [Saprolegnia parasitica CBS 223.65]KDO28342.1 hypothetical protein SPRG_06581 [Saprolegnia parasitica CBS 223.65]|eukprot:XP_012200790.1 hypothetical protein SPRG_06581 [Saprolegnia parasitica CBS 223.65]
MESAAEDVGRGLVATLSAVALLGFGEACVLCKKPVPLRYALRFATHNVLHSFVWRTIESPLLCHAARLPSVALNDASLLSEGLRAARYLIASYGLVHQLLRLHTPVTPQQDAIRTPLDRVVRLSPGTSRLSGVSAQQESSSSATRVLPIAWNSMSREDVQIRMHEWCLQHEAPLRDDLFLLEVDLSAPFPSRAEADIAVHAMRGLVRPFRGPDALARHLDAIVVVLASPWAMPSVLDHPSCDVVVNTAAVVAHTVAGFVQRAQAAPTTSVCIYADSAALTQGLLQEDIVACAADISRASVATTEAFIVALEHGGAACVESLLAQGVPPTQIIWVQQQPQSVDSAAWVVHIPTLLNEELAVIRAQLRCGMSAALVQDNVRDKYGPLNALQGDAPFRRDRHSVVRVV